MTPLRWVLLLAMRQAGRPVRTYEAVAAARRGISPTLTARDVLDELHAMLDARVARRIVSRRADWLWVAL